MTQNKKKGVKLQLKVPSIFETAENWNKKKEQEYCVQVRSPVRLSGSGEGKQFFLFFLMPRYHAPNKFALSRTSLVVFLLDG